MSRFTTSFTCRHFQILTVFSSVSFALLSRSHSHAFCLLSRLYGHLIGLFLCERARAKRKWNYYFYCFRFAFLGLYLFSKHSSTFCFLFLLTIRSLVYLGIIDHAYPLSATIFTENSLVPPPPPTGSQDNLAMRANRQWKFRSLCIAISIANRG